MTSNFVEQPILSSNEVAFLLRETGLDFERWPQSILPDEVLQILDAGSDQDMEMLTIHGADFEGQTPPEYRSHLIAENRRPRAIIRTSWGLLIGDRWNSDAQAGGKLMRYLIQIEPAKGWMYGMLGAYSDVLMETLGESVEVFNRKERAEIIEMSYAAMSSILELSVFIGPDDGEDAKKKAANALVDYLADIFENGTIETMVEKACAGKPMDVASTATMVEMRPDTHQGPADRFPHLP